MGNIKVLDCTLRDGGYVNEWQFGLTKAKEILEQLLLSNIDFIETGFIQEGNFSEEQTLFNSFDDIKKIIPENAEKDRLFAMITYGKFPIEKVPSVDKSPVKGIRLIFKKKQKEEALKYCRELKQKGYKLFINPTFIDQYTDKELIDIITDINDISPYGMSIVDSMGVLREKEISRIFYIIDNNLKANLALCFHSHNNLQLSFSDAQCLIKVCNQRELIIDSTVFGIGRGAGNLCTELLIQYINDNYGGNYQLIPILKIVDEQINPIFAKSPWGYSVPFYLAAINNCHPNYAKYLVDKQTVPVEMINTILKKIPENKKATYDADFIKQLYLDMFSKTADDTISMQHLQQVLRDRNILIIAPGKSINIESKKINEYIKNANPFIISLNFIPENYNVDLCFVTSIKRFANIENNSVKLAVTSNIENPPKDALIFNYSSYLNNSKMYDSAALMLFKLFISMGIKELSIAGLDGFNTNPADNYASDSLINNNRLNEFDERNSTMSEMIEQFSKHLKFNFITKTKYQL